MSGRNWVDRVPENWNLVRFSKAYRFSRGLDIKKQDLSDHGLPVISYGQIHAKDNPGVRISDRHIRYIPKDLVREAQLGRALLEEGDIVFADTSEDIEGAGNMVRAVGGSTLYAGYHALIARPSSGFRHTYMAYQMISPSWRQQIQRSVQGVKVYSITQRIFNEVTILQPPLHEQQTIARYLDLKTAEIDALVEKLVRQVELLERYRRELIARSVTRGLNPDVPMRDSGIEWAHHIPVGWSVYPFVAVLCHEKQLNTDLLVKNALQFKNGSIAKKANWEPSDHGLDEILSSYKLVRPGMIVINGLNLNYDFTTKRIGLVTQPGAITSAYLTLSVLPTVNERFVAYLLRSMDSQLLFHGMTEGVRKILTWRDIRRELLPMPPFQEQSAIADYLDEKMSEIDSTVSGIRKQIELLGKYRKQVINDAVTGKVRVGEVA
ncbi:hypothetical protein [Corynebacterium resistens]|uniref:hypothetical protein n=1 Tax=Corynebacterium resistens TaxID=258224 RepID=UPI002352DB81|nr:hypothetical protein [Corynebacterium resistens]